MKAHVHGYPRHYHREVHLHIGAVRSNTHTPSVSLRCFRPWVHLQNRSTGPGPLVTTPMTPTPTPASSGQFVQWWACYLLLGAAFYYFSSPLHDARARRQKWSLYAVVTYALYAWLGLRGKGGPQGLWGPFWTPFKVTGVAPPSTHPTPPHMIYCWKDLLPGFNLAGVSGPQVGLG